MPTLHVILAAIGYAALTGLFNLIFSEKTQIEAWCAANPRLAAIGMFMRSVGYDPHNMWAFATLLITKKLPAIKLPNSDVVRAEVRKLDAKALAGSLLVLLFCCSLPALHGCARFAKVDWAAVEKCAEQPAESALTQIVTGVLAGTGDVKTELEGVAIEYGAGAVKCAVAQIVHDLGSAPVTARASRQAERGRAFLAQVGK